MDYIDKFNNLPEKLRSYLFGNEIRFDLEKACFLYGLQIKQIQAVSDPIALIFVKEISLTKFPVLISENANLSVDVAYGIAYEINKRIFNRFPEYFSDASTLLNEWQKVKSNPLISEDAAYKKLIEFEPWILDKDGSEKNNINQKKPATISYIKKSLIDVLKNQPEIGEKTVTTAMIKLQNSSEPVRPSVKNWIADYFSSLGNEKHDSMQRGTYLFRSPNGKNLNASDRFRLDYILKSLDENSPIDIDPQTGQIVFPVLKLAEKPVVASAGQNVSQSAPQISVRPSLADHITIGPTAPTSKNQVARPVSHPVLPPRTQPQAPTFGQTLPPVNHPAAPLKNIAPEPKKQSLQLLRSGEPKKITGNIQNASFSSPQKMSFEKNQVHQTGLRDYLSKKPISEVSQAKNILSTDAVPTPAKTISATDQPAPKKLADFLISGKKQPTDQARANISQNLSEKNPPRNANIVNLKELL